MSGEQDKPRLPFALFDGALSGLQSAMRTAAGLAAAPFGRGDAAAPTEASSDANAQSGAEAHARDEGDAVNADGSNAAGDVLAAPQTDVLDASPTALAAALDARGQDDLAAHADGTTGETTKPSVIDRIPRADEAQAGIQVGHSDHEQPAPDEELGPKPFTPQVGP